MKPDRDALERSVTAAKANIESWRGLIADGIPAHANMANGLERLAQCLIEMGRPKDAIAPQSEALGIRRGFAKDDPKNDLVAFAESALRTAMLLFNLRRTDEANTVADEAVTAWQTLVSRGRLSAGYLGQALRVKAKACDQAGNLDAARAAIAQALRVVWPALQAEPNVVRRVAVSIVEDYADLHGVDDEVIEKRRFLASLPAS